jgi:hypothetical protein
MIVALMGLLVVLALVLCVCMVHDAIQPSDTAMAIFAFAFVVITAVVYRASLEEK